MPCVWGAHRVPRVALTGRLSEIFNSGAKWDILRSLELGPGSNQFSREDCHRNPSTPASQLTMQCPCHTLPSPTAEGQPYTTIFTAAS